MKSWWWFWSMSWSFLFLWLRMIWRLEMEKVCFFWILNSEFLRFEAEKRKKKYFLSLSVLASYILWNPELKRSGTGQTFNLHGRSMFFWILNFPEQRKEKRELFIYLFLFKYQCELYQWNPELKRSGLLLVGSCEMR